MIETLQELTEQYTAALENYLASGKEETLQRAYELGRKAIAEGVGVLEMAAIHNKSLAAVFANPLTHQEALRVAGHASTFFAESLSPFEMVLRGYREANARLRANLQQIEAAEQELQRQNRELAAAHRLVEAERERYQELFNFAPDAYFVTDLEGIVQEVNSPAAHLFKIQKDSLAGTPLLRFVSEREQESFCDLLGKLRNGEVERVEDWQVTLQVQGGGAVPVSLRSQVVRDARGNRLGLRWLMSDITERKQIEEERAQIRIREHIARTEMEAAQQLKFLSEVSTTLATSLAYETIPGTIARLSVPYFADSCFVHLIEDLVSVRHLAVAHSDPSKVGQASRLQQCCSTQTKIPEPLAAILQSTQAEMIREISDAWLERFAGSQDALGILREWNLKSALLVPLWANERSLGAITFVRSEGSLPYTGEDLTLGEEFARRCSLVLDNARLHSQVVAERDRAEKASQAKDEFVAILSHELRTPLTIILGWARVLKKQTAIQKDPMLNEGVQVLEHNARNIARLVEDCLDIARIAQRKIELQKELVDLNQVVKAALEAMREAVCNKGLHYLIHLCPTNLRVLGDRTRLEQVVLNLLTNA
ncbi:MAG: PAS domain S-box protein, partial [Acidobacteria bacterium]|nr:PAS domain S-box protein [Acidobacteriota bacterium]